MLRRGGLFLRRWFGFDLGRLIGFVSLLLLELIQFIAETLQFFRLLDDQILRRLQFLFETNLLDRRIHQSSAGRLGSRVADAGMVRRAS